MTTRLLPTPGVQVLSGLFLSFIKSSVHVTQTQPWNAIHRSEREAQLSQSFLFLCPATAASPRNSSGTHQSIETYTWVLLPFCHYKITFLSENKWYDPLHGNMPAFFFMDYCSSFKICWFSSLNTIFKKGCFSVIYSLEGNLQQLN